MEGTGASSPGLPPDPSPAQVPPPQLQAFQEPFIAGSPQLAPQSQPQPELKRNASMRSRNMSNAQPVLHQPQPIRDAVDKAFDQSTGNHLDPAFVAQVTEAVVKNLQNASLATSTPAPNGNTSYPPPSSVQSVPHSPTQSSTASIPNRYTPPSPHRDKRAGSHGSASPEPTPSEAGSSFSRGSYRSYHSKQSERDGDTPRPPEDDLGVRRSNTGRRRTQDSNDRYVPRQTSESGRDGDALPRRDSEDSVGSISSQLDGPRRPRRSKVLSPVEETTTLEKIWQPLFDNGNPTVRLSQFLRGLANHLIDDYEPRGSLVVTPAKMLRFLEETRVENELYPWHLIFGGAMSSSSISVMYRRLLCQHHLVQIQYHEVPTVPGLTPGGFEAFMTTLIQAHPDGEFERLAKAVMNMPISNADNRSERFPKELSRRLLPSLANPLAEQRIIASMAHEGQLLQLKNSTTMPPPPPSAPPQSFQERERKPYSHTSFSNAFDDDDLAAPSAPSVPIERERKPYFAKEGTGKQYGDEPEPRADSNPYSSNMPPRPVRQNSGPMPSSFGNGAPSDPRSIPQPSRPRMPSTPFSNGNSGKGRRSPPPSNPFARSEPLNVGDISAAQYASNLHNPRTPGNFDREPEENPLHRAPSRRANPAKNSYDDDLPTRGKPIPSRNGPPPPVGYDSTYMSTVPPVGGSYPTRPRPMSTYDDRRRSQYGPGSMAAGPGGSDGWGSFANGVGGYPPQSYGGTVQH